MTTFKWIKFIPSRTRGEPRLFLSRRGFITLNAAFCRKFGINKYVVLYCDPDAKVGAMEFVADESSPGAIKVGQRKITSFRCTSYMDEFDLHTFADKHYAVARDQETGFLMFNLVKAIDPQRRKTRQGGIRK